MAQHSPNNLSWCNIPLTDFFIGIQVEFELKLYKTIVVTTYVRIIITYILYCLFLT
jgi:hypothetical protein